MKLLFFSKKQKINIKIMTYKNESGRFKTKNKQIKLKGAKITYF